MKYIKLFEEDKRKSEYKTGDYVYIEQSDWMIEPVVKIDDFWWFDESNSYDYRVESFIKDEYEGGYYSGFQYTTIGEGDIIRKCTKEEIENFELRKLVGEEMWKATNKYNL